MVDIVRYIRHTIEMHMVSGCRLVLLKKAFFKKEDAEK
jgi:hypothetical protein